MTLVRACGQARRFVGRMTTAGLMAIGSIVGADAQNSASEAGSAVSIVEPGAETTVAPEGSDDEEMLFSDGPREPTVLSAEGTLIGSGAKQLESRAEDGAVAALVAEVGAGANASDFDGGGKFEEIEEAEVGEARRPSPGLLEKIRGNLGLGGD